MSVSVPVVLSGLISLSEVEKKKLIGPVLVMGAIN